MWEVFNTIAANSGFAFEVMICLVFGLGGIVFYAKDYKIGVILHWLVWALTFIWFYQAGLNWTIPLTLFFIWFVVLAFSLYPVSKAADQGVFI